MFKHFIITRFNLLGFANNEEKTEEWCEWTRNRIDLFKTYCLASLKNQTNQDFTWLLYFDRQTPEDLLASIEELRAFDFIRIRFVEGYKSFMKSYMCDVKQMAGSSQWVITSRIDNDDLLEKEAVDIIQGNFRPSDGFLISLASGYTLDNRKEVLSHYYYPMSPFISMVESTSGSELQGIFLHEHTRWPDLKFSFRKELSGSGENAAFLYGKPRWIQLIHGENVANSSKRGFPVLHSKDLSTFGIDLQSRGQSWRLVFGHYNFVIWKHYFQISLIRLIRRSKKND